MRGPRYAAVLLLVGSVAAAAVPPPAAALAHAEEPGAPTELTAERRAGFVALEWAPPEAGDAEAYTVYRRDHPEDAWETVGRSLNTTYRDDSAPRPLPDGGDPTLQYAIAARGPSGEGPPSSPATVHQDGPYLEIMEPSGGDVHGCMLGRFCEPALAHAHLDAALCAPEGHQIDMGEACDVAWAAGLVYVEAYAACQADLDEIAFRVDDEPWHDEPEPVREGEYRWTWDAEGKPVGERTLRVEATCQDGAEATATQRLFVLGPTQPRPFAEASAAADGIRADGAADLEHRPDLDVGTDDPSRGCVDASLAAGTYFLEQEAHETGCWSTPWAWSLSLVAHRIHASADGQDAHLGEVADGERPATIEAGEDTSFCVAADAEADPERAEARRHSRGSCQLAPIATGTYRLSLLKDGWWLHARVSGYDPLGGATPVPPSAEVWTEEDPEVDDCYGVVVEAPSVGTVGAVVGPIQEPWPSTLIGDGPPDHVDPDGEGCPEV